MDTNLNPEKLGQRLAMLRKRRGLSQEVLAQRLELSRSSLAQIELGKRNVDAFELRALSIALEFSIDHLFSEEFEADLEASGGGAVFAEEKNIRVAKPRLNVPKLKQVLLYLLQRCAGKPNVGETVLNKLLYFSDFNHYEIYEEHLTGARYRKMPYGPVPQRLDQVLAKMVEDGELQRIKTEFHGFAQTRYIPLIAADLTLLKASEKEVMDKVIDQLGDLSATRISEYSHLDMPWLASQEGEEMDYELAFYRNPPFSVRSYARESED